MGDNVKVVDACNTFCPGPLMELISNMKQIEVGDVIELWATDPGVKSDVQAWAAKTKNEIVSIEDQKDKIVSVLKIVHR